MRKRNKIILTVIMVMFIIAFGITLYFVLKSQSNSYPKETVEQSSLGSTRQSVDLGNTQILNSDGYLYTISKIVMLEKVHALVQLLNPKFVQIANEVGVYYKWENASDYAIYELDQNTVIFAVAKGITWDEASMNAYSFSQFADKYFQKDWDYSIAKVEKQPSGETIYYAKRVVNDLDVETIFNNQSTDYLATKNGKIVYGKILLSEFVKVSEKLPLISSTELDKYVNLEGYPKEIYPEYGSIQDTILSAVDYKSDDFDNIVKTLTNCKSTSSSIIYLYKSLSQGNMTPVYKLDLQCEITYKDTVYTIPAVGYVNAINPKYVSSSE